MTVRVLAYGIALALIVSFVQAVDAVADEGPPGWTVATMEDAHRTPVDLSAGLAWWADRGVTMSADLNRHGFTGCDGIDTWTGQNLTLRGEPVQGIGDWCVLVLDPTSADGLPLSSADSCLLMLHELGHALGLEHEDANVDPVMEPSWTTTSPACGEPAVQPVPRAARPRKARKTRKKARLHVRSREGRLHRL